MKNIFHFKKKEKKNQNAIFFYHLIYYFDLFCEKIFKIMYVVRFAENCYLRYM